MSDSAHAAEQQQLRVEIEAVLKSLGQRGDAGKTSYEIEQGRKLIEKAVSLGLPEGDYADLQRHVAGHDGKTDGR